jgi:hypothetical protein
MAKTVALNFGVHLSNKTPNCPYLGSPCIKFSFSSVRGVCCTGESRCKYLPDWEKSGSNGRFAVLKGDSLHV